jgi:hypothetical protein
MNTFKPHSWYKKIYYKLRLFFNHIQYPENVWDGGGYKRESALRSVGKGWSKLINNLYDAKPKYTNVQQVKEKYGTLRFYVSSAPEWYFDLIDYYEEESSKICEQCGKPGKLRLDRGWYLTLCDDCDRIDKESRS